jgi:segregation and condensation protein B
MAPADLKKILEALLFSSDQPLTLDLISAVVEAEPGEIVMRLEELGQEYERQGRGFRLRQMAGGWLLVTDPDMAEWVSKLLRGKRKMRLSRAALETMAIVAYKQPVTKSEIDEIRGVDSSAVLATLLERNLVTIRGRSKLVGRPLLYGTTQEFLGYFGLKDLGELPRPEELRALVAARTPEQLEIAEVEALAEVASDLVTHSDVEPEAAAEEDRSSTDLTEEAEAADAATEGLRAHGPAKAE